MLVLSITNFVKMFNLSTFKLGNCTCKLIHHTITNHIR